MANVNNDKVMTNTAIANWNEERGAWLVFVTDNAERVQFFEVRACDEWVIPMALSAFNGITYPLSADNDEWYCEPCEDSAYPFEDWITQNL